MTRRKGVPVMRHTRTSATPRAREEQSGAALESPPLARKIGGRPPSTGRIVTARLRCTACGRAFPFRYPEGGRLDRLAAIERLCDACFDGWIHTEPEAWNSGTGVESEDV